MASIGKPLAQPVAHARLLLIALVTTLGTFSADSQADQIELVNGEKVAGVIRATADGVLQVSVDPANKTNRAVPLIDAIRIVIEPAFDRVRPTAALINNDKAGTGRSRSASVRLRAGFHRIAIPYWHGDGRTFLRLQYSHRQGTRQKFPLRIVPPSILYHADAQSAVTESPGVDKEGYRLPAKVDAAKLQLTYSMRRLEGGAFQALTDLLRANRVEQSGLLDRVTNKPVTDDMQQVALFFSGFIKIAEEGDYTFLLSSDGGSELYIGQVPAIFNRIDSGAPAAPWRVELVGGASLTGTLEKWDAAGITLGVISASSRVEVKVPTERIAEVWRNPLGKDDVIDREQLPPKEDVVYARSNSGRVQRVPGKVKAVAGDALVMEFGGVDRRVAIAKVAGAILASAGRSASAPQEFHQLVHTLGGHRIPGQLLSLEEGMLKLRTSWGQELGVAIDEISSISIENGRTMQLARLPVKSIEQTPYFDRLVPYRVNESLSGGKLVLRDGVYSHGLSVQSRTALAYALGKQFRRFRVKCGFETPEGALGDADVKIVGDGKTLWEKSSFRGVDPPQLVELDVSGVETLSLIVDFGKNEDVADRVIWAEPTLIRDQVPKVAQQ